MSDKTMVTIDGNTATAYVAYALSEVAAIYPITPSSSMGEEVDTWASKGQKNIYGKVLDVIEMQSEGGAAGAVHGSLSAGAMTTTYTASQGLLLMIPNMYKIAGEMLPTVFHVSARSLACQSLSIYGDHGDVMAARNTGFALLASNSVQENMDMALIAHLSTYKSQVPFLHFFDGWRTSSEVQKVEQFSQNIIAELVEQQYIQQFKNRAMVPEKPYLKVGAQNPDVYFQGRETVNKYYDAVPTIVQEYMDKVAKVLGRQYHLCDYVGHPNAEKIVIAMGSACDTIEETIKYLNNKGAKLGLIKMRLYRPFPVKMLISAIPASCKKIAVLDRTKEPGAPGEPLFLDVQAALAGKNIQIIGGRYGLSSKEFTPSMAAAVYDHLDGQAYHDFTVGINDDVTNLSIPVKTELNIGAKDIKSCIFWGYGSDGTVGAAKNSIKIIGENTEMNAQAYFVYDSKKSGGITISYLRFGKSPLNMPYLISNADFVACHNPAYIGRYDMLGALKEGGTFLLNSEIDSSVVFNHLTRDMQETIIKKKIKFYNIDALKIAESVGLGGRINTVMQAAFFKIANILHETEAIALIKSAIEKSFKKKGDDIIKMNWECVDKTAAALVEVKVPAQITESYVPQPLIPADAIPFAKEVIEPVMRLNGDLLPVSRMSFDGIIPTATTSLEKRGIAPSVPKWIPDNCIQCNQCVMSCPHAVIRAKQIDPDDLKGAPAAFHTLKSTTKNSRELRYKIQVYIEDCTGCGVCIDTCPAKTKALEFSPLHTEREAGEDVNFKFFDKLPNNVTEGASLTTIKGVQFMKPLFEFSGACGGCGETPYIKLATQLYGDRMVVANATGCSSIYSGSFPTVPYCKNDRGHGPTWANSLFEDNAEYGLGMRLAVNSNRTLLKLKVEEAFAAGLKGDLEAALRKCINLWDNKEEEAKMAQIAVQLLLPQALKTADAKLKPILEKINELQYYFVDKSVWIIGGDGWAYDIGYGGLDHVLASGRDVNILVLDTEVYSNTGGQASKSTPIGAVAKFANNGMRLSKKNLGFMCMSYGYVYVASIAMGANRNQTLKAFLEAENYKGPSIIIAYAPCINHGIDMGKSQTEEKRAVQSGYWPLYRFNPAAEEGKKFSWESPDQTLDYQEFIQSEIRYSSLRVTSPADAEAVFKESEKDAKKRFDFFKKIGGIL